MTILEAPAVLLLSLGSLAGQASGDTTSASDVPPHPGSLAVAGPSETEGAEDEADPSEGQRKSPASTNAEGDGPASERVTQDAAASPGQQGAARSTAPAQKRAAQDKPEDSALPAEETSPPPPCAPVTPQFSTLALAEGLAHYGGFSQGEDLSDPDAEHERYRTGLVGGQLTLGVMPGGRNFTMAGRLRGGVYLGEGRQWGTLGAAMLFGASFLRDGSGRSFGYALGGFGVEFLPGLNQDMLTLHLAGGTVIGGFNFSAGVDLGGNDQVAHALFGMQLGWGQLF